MNNGGTKVIPALFNMPELLLCGVGNEIIYDKEKETRPINLDCGMQRSSNVWKYSKGDLIISVLSGENDVIPPVIRQ